MSDPTGQLTTYSELAAVLDALPLLCREKRRRDGLSLREAARQMGMSAATVSRFEAGNGAHMDNAAAILRWLDGKQDPPPSPLGDGRHFGICPKCGEKKIIGHGPLCWECFTAAAPSTTGAEARGGQG